ncbi:MAG: response regulator [Candidatus Anammoxibacter sp.]
MEKIKILIVEDEWIIASDIKDSLEKLGYDIPKIVSTGEEAIQYVNECKPDLVIMDIMLQGKMDGIEAAGKIQLFYSVPIIYLTAHSDKDTLERAKITDPFGYIIKPLKIREAHILIEMAIHKHEAERKLKESEEWFSTTLASIGDAVIATDTKGIVTFLNPVAQSMINWNREDACGKHLRDIVKIINNGTDKEEDCPVTKVIKSGNAIELKNHTLVDKAGKKIPISDSAAPIRNGEGKIIGVVFVFSDITEQKRAEEERERLVKEREEALDKVKILSGFIPICAACKQIRDDDGNWNQIEEYIRDHSEAEFTHGMCPKCLREYYPEIYKDKKEE